MTWDNFRYLIYPRHSSVLLYDTSTITVNAVDVVALRRRASSVSSSVYFLDILAFDLVVATQALDPCLGVVLCGVLLCCSWCCVFLLSLFSFVFNHF